MEHCSKLIFRINCPFEIHLTCFNNLNNLGYKQCKHVYILTCMQLNWQQLFVFLTIDSLPIFSLQLRYLGIWMHDIPVHSRKISFPCTVRWNAHVYVYHTLVTRSGIAFLLPVIQEWIPVFSEDYQAWLHISRGFRWSGIWSDTEDSSMFYTIAQYWDKVLTVVTSCFLLQ